MNKKYLKNLTLTIGTLAGIASMTADAQTLVTGLYSHDDLYTYNDEVFVHDLSNVRSEDLSTGQVYEDAVTQIWPFVNHNYLDGDLVLAGRNYYFYEPKPGNVNFQEDYPMYFSVQPDTMVRNDYTINDLTFMDVIELLDMPPFDITANGGIGGFIIAPVERDTGKLVPQEDIELYPGINNYAPQFGQLVPHSSRNDVYYYVADPGFNGVDRILMFSRNREGKMGYQFYFVHVSNN